MDITVRMLRDTTEAAMKNIIDKAKLPHETHEEFIGRCWYQAFEGTVKKHGYQIATIDPTTGAAVVCKFTPPTR